MPQNILETIVELCEQGLAVGYNRKLSDVKSLASKNVNILTQILHEYISQNEEDPTYRKHRLRGAKRMLGYKE
jgi:hypothetical protein